MGMSFLHAQGPVRDRIKTLKVAFITERVGLTSQEAQQFWPIYNEHEDAMENIRRKEVQARLSAAQGLSDSESAALLDNFIALETEKHNADQLFISKVREVISPKKVLLLLKAEDDFKKRLLQQYRRKQGGG
jgi:hypothetical protein